MDRAGADGVQIRKTMCDICTPGLQCGVDAYVKDGRVVRMEGTDGFPVSNGRLCARGAAGRQYLYRADRIQTPMRRVGPRGSDRFEPISWDEALDICASELLKQRRADPDGVVFLTGYPKWYRPFLHRLAHSFGTENYITESSACHRAEVMSYKAVCGQTMFVPVGGAETVILWGSNPQVSAYPLGGAMLDLRDRGGNIVVIDPRRTQAAGQLANVYLRPKAGTDAALAHAMANVILQNGWQDTAFIERYVHGFEAYRAMVSAFTPEYAAAVTGVAAEDIERVAKMLAMDPTGVIVPSNALTHRENGFNTHRAVISLMVLLGRVGRRGILAENDSYCHSDGGFVSRELEFIDGPRPKKGKKAVGCGRFPLWDDMVDEGQGMDLVRQIEQGTPYPIRAMACFGVNDRMYPESPRFLAAMDRLDFSFAVDIFWTDVCRHADIVLPACTSYERGEVRCYGGRFVNYTQPAVEPLYESRPDTEIIFDLSRRMGLDDALLNAGYDACIEYIFAPSGITDWQAVKDAPLPVPVPNAKRPEPERFLENIQTPSGKLELYSEQAARYPHLDPLPRFAAPETNADYPFTLIAGARLPNTLHSRLHDVAWLRFLRPDAAVDICHADAERLGVTEGEAVYLETKVGQICVKAHITETVAEGEAAMYHGYREANVNAILPMDCLDPYTGFPAYKQFVCRIRRAGKEETL